MTRVVWLPRWGQSTASLRHIRDDIHSPRSIHYLIHALPFLEARDADKVRYERLLTAYLQKDERLCALHAFGFVGRCKLKVACAISS